MRTVSMSLLVCAALLIVGCGGAGSPPLTASPGSTTTATSGSGSGTNTGGSGGTGSGASVKGPFAATGSMITARASHTATLLPNGKVLIAGGAGDGFQPLSSAELYDPSTGMFTPTGSMTTVRTWHTATLLANGTVLIVGGSDVATSTYEPLASAELYDPSTGKFTLTGSMPAAQRTGLATSLKDGRVFVAGDSYAAIYDPASGTFAQTSPYTDATPVFWITANLLADGRVLLTGCAAQCTVGATEIFDPKSGTFSTTGPMTGSTWANQNTATSLTNSKILFVGNDENDGVFADAEVYDPAAGTFMSIGNALAPHEFAAAAPLTDGSVLITGGQLIGGNGNSGSEVYVSATGAFASAGNMNTPRHSHTATLLPDGTVLIVGGYSTWPKPTASAELYDPSCKGCWDY